MHFNKFWLKILEWEFSPHLLPFIGLYKYTCGVVGCAKVAQAFWLPPWSVYRDFKEGQGVNKNALSPDPPPVHQKVCISIDSEWFKTEYKMYRSRIHSNMNVSGHFSHSTKIVAPSLCCFFFDLSICIQEWSKML